MDDIKKTCKKVKNFSAPFLLTAALLCTVYAIFGLFPFGNKTLAWGDMKQQVIPLMLEFTDIIKGKAGFFLNMQNAGGMSFFGVFFFFLSSPFTFSALCVEKGQIYYLVNILVLLKLSLASTTAFYFFYREHPNLSKAVHLSLAVSYGMCGYGLLYFQNLVWLDILYLFPLVILGFMKMVRQGKCAFFIFYLSMMVVVNYYLSYMVYLALLLFSTLFIFFCVPKDSRGAIAGKLGACALLSLILTAVVWLPSLIQCLSSARTAKGILASLQDGELFTELTTTLPMLLCTAAPICLPFLWKPSSFTPKEKAISLSFLGSVIPLVFEPINKMWHTGSYQAFPARYGYFPLFLAIWLFSEFLAKDVASDKEKDSTRLAIAGVSFGLALLFLLCVFVLLFNFENLSSYSRCLWLDQTSFSLLLIFTLCAAVLQLALCLLFRKGKAGIQLLGGGLLSICLIQSIFCGSVFLGSPSNVPEKEQTILQTENDILDDGLYRAKLDTKLCDVNLLGAAGYPTLNHYTSLTDERFLYGMKKLGYSSYWMEASACCGTEISDILLSNKYVLNSFGEWSQTGSGDIGCLVPSGALPKALKHTNRFALQNAIYAALTGDREDAFQRCAMQKSFGLRLQHKDGNTEISLISESPGEIFYEINVTDQAVLYFDAFSQISTRLRENINDAFSVEVNGALFCKSYPTQKCNGILNLGTFSNEKVTVKISISKNVLLRSFGIYSLKKEKSRQFAASLENISLSYQNGRIAGNFETWQKGTSLFLSVPNYLGTKIYVDGKEADFSSVMDCFIEVPLRPGQHNVLLQYVPTGFWEGGAVSSIGCIAVLLRPLYKKKRAMAHVKTWWFQHAWFLLRLAFSMEIAVVYAAPFFLWLWGKL